jgi:SSS family solute:Na+ symporter
MQTLFSFFNAPLFATFLLGMFWKRATPWGGFWGLVAGTAGAILLMVAIPENFFTSPQEGNFWRAWWAWVITVVVTVIVSLFTKPKTDEELKGLVYGTTSLPSYRGWKWYLRPGWMAVVAALLLVGLNWYFW